MPIVRGERAVSGARKTGRTDMKSMSFEVGRRDVGPVNLVKLMDLANLATPVNLVSLVDLESLVNLESFVDLESLVRQTGLLWFTSEGVTSQEPGEVADRDVVASGTCLGDNTTWHEID
jgi:hypothetical protein